MSSTKIIKLLKELRGHRAFHKQAHDDVQSVISTLEQAQVDVERLKQDIRSHLHDKMKDCKFELANAIKDDIIRYCADCTADHLHAQGRILGESTKEDEHG